MLLHNIKERCKECGLNIAQLERAADILPNSIYKWDEVMPAADKLCRVASVLGTTSEELLRKDEEEVTESA